MRFQPKTEDQIREENLLPEGEYDYEVTAAVEGQSKAGNDMITLTLKIYKPDGSTKIISDWLLEKMAFKLIHFCESAGLMDEYERGDLTSAHCEGRSGKLILEIQPGKGGNGPRNSVTDYLVNEDSEPSRDLTDKIVGTVPSEKTSFKDDEIPW